jgi:tRNA pseudouridine55 synthase
MAARWIWQRRASWLWICPANAKTNKTGEFSHPLGSQVIGVNGGCKLLSRYLLNCDKEYLVHGQLGTVTDTLDATGTVTAHRPFAHVTSESLGRTLQGFVPGYLQEAPLFSALKVDGKRLSDLVRQGATVEAKNRMVEIHRIDLLEFDPPSFKFGAWFWFVS